MEDAGPVRPHWFRRSIAVSVALAVGAAGWLLAYELADLAVTRGIEHVTPISQWGFWWFVGLLTAVCLVILTTLVIGGAELHDRILRPCGERAHILRSPRGTRFVWAWLGGTAAGFAAPLAVALVMRGLDQPRNPEYELPRMFSSAFWTVILVGPSTGVLVTRALCRRWGTPRPPASPAAAPRPAPLAAPRGEDPGSSLLPASA